MKSIRIHVQPHTSGGWQVKRDDAARASSVHDTKESAVAAGRETARREELELVVHTKDGKIENPNSYGNDPPSKKDNVH
jgi:hypothetical protein